MYPDAPLYGFDGVTLDIAAYFTRIGYRGPAAPTLATLREIVAGHVAAVPFENLDVLRGAGVSLLLPEVERKLITARRGGYCFEQNTLLMGVLRQIGFKVTPLSARVRMVLPRQSVPPRTHVFLRVEIDGTPWLADAGVGGVSPTAPLRMNTPDEQPTTHESHRIIHEDGRWFHQVLLHKPEGPAWVDIYDFTGEPMPAIDREIGNWWTSTNPGSKFRQKLMAAISPRDGTRRLLENRRFTRRRGGEVLEVREIDSADALLSLLETEFGVSFPGGTRFGPPGSPWPCE